MRTRFHRAVSGAPLAALLGWSLPLLAQTTVPSFPREGARNVLDNGNVAIWDVTWPNGKSTAMLERRYDQVTVTLAEGAVKVTRADRTWTVEHSRVGAVHYESKGTVAAEEGVSDRPRRAMIFEIKSSGRRPGIPRLLASSVSCHFHRVQGGTNHRCFADAMTPVCRTDGEP